MIIEAVGSEKPKKTNKFTLVAIVVALIATPALTFCIITGMSRGSMTKLTEFQQYERYYRLHQCKREIISGQAYLGCDNGAWSERDFISVANGRVPNH